MKKLLIDVYHEQHGNHEISVPKRGRTNLCPSEFGYEKDDYACDEMESCEACWKRPYEGGYSTKIVEKKW